MIELVSRAVSVIESGWENDSEDASKPLKEYRSCPAYVLLGAPGSGKTTAFQKEADSCGNGEYIPAREFIIPHLTKPEWARKILFIDGLDETRAGVADARTPFDQIRSKLQQLNCSRFRLSCRAGYWLGVHDKRKLEQLGQNVVLLTLDPLDEQGILGVLRLNQLPKNGGPEEFINMARARGLGACLNNPQHLVLLAKAMGKGGDWPTSNKEVYEKACEILLSEENEEHRVSGVGQTDPSTLSGIAGRLCAVQILSGCAGYTLSPGKPCEDYPAVEQVLSEGQEGGVRIPPVYERIAGQNQAVPVHQSIAEFLGGRYLARQVDQGLSANRILALMSAADKTVVPNLHGIATWFAAYSGRAREELIKRNPLETALDGDVESFDIGEKRQLLDELRKKASDNPSFIKIVRRNTSLRGLASPDLHADLEKILRQPAHSDSEQSVRYLVLKALDCGSAAPGFRDILLEIIRDRSSWHANQWLALGVLIKTGPRSADTVEHLKRLFAEVRNGSIRDFHGRLLSTLLVELFPQHIAIDEVLDYLTDSRQILAADVYTFWANRMATRLSSEQLTDTLNKLALRVKEAVGSNLSHASFRLFRAFLAILEAFFLSKLSAEINLTDVRHWLEIAWCSEIQDTVSSDHERVASSVQNWLKLQPDKHRKMFEDGVREWIDAGEFKLRALETDNWLFGIQPEPDFWPWCLDRAIQAEHSKAAQFFLKQVVDVLLRESGEIDFSLNDIQARVAGHQELREALEDRLICRLPEDHFKGIEERLKLKSIDLSEREQAHRDLVEQVKAHEKEFRENRAPLRLLHDLAFAYFGYFADVVGDQPRERIRDLLGNDPHVVHMVLEALKKSISRKDVPKVIEIIRSAKRGHSHPLTYPCLAGLGEAGSPPSKERQIRCALALHYFADHAFPGQVSLKWYQILLVNRPEVVSEILVRRIRFQMRRGEEHLTDSYELAFSRSHVKVARLATLPLLKSFPVRCTAPQLRALGHLLAAALLQCKRKGLRGLLKTKLEKKSTKNMNVGQQIYWLATGFLVAPKTYRRQLESNLQGDGRRIRYFVELVCQGSESSEWNDLLKGSCIEPLIKLIGSSFRHVSLDEEMAWSSPPMAASGLVHGLIGHLAESNTPEATDSLSRLVSDEGLSEWRLYLQDAADEQRTVRRQAEFVSCSVGRILEALDNKYPANLDDLVVLLLETFDEMGRKIRDGATNDWRQYWNHLPGQWIPKYENDCRDMLLSDLQEKFATDIHAAKEGVHADDARADIQVTYKNLSIPIEIKKSDSNQLWDGIKNQLIPKYSRDPSADGRGIYLVFWFGKDYLSRSRQGISPASPADLKLQLENTLTPEEADKIAVCMIDVARP